MGRLHRVLSGRDHSLLPSKRYFDDKIAGFSRVPAWLQVVHEQLNLSVYLTFKHYNKSVHAAQSDLV